MDRDFFFCYLNRYIEVKWIEVSARRMMENDRKTGHLPDLKKLNLHHSLHDAVRYSNVKLVKTFIALKANVNEKEAKSGQTPIHIAAFFGYKKIIKLLLKAGADLDITDDQGNTALHLAALTHRKVEIVKLLMHINVNTKNNSGQTPLHYAVGRCDDDSERIVVFATGAEVWRRHRCYESFMLESAFFDNAPAVVKHFWESGADLNAKDANGQTPLHVAAICNRVQTHIRVIKMMLKYGAYVFAKTHEGKTPWEMVLTSSPKLRELLLKSQSKFNAKYSSQDKAKFEDDNLKITIYESPLLGKKSHD